MDEAVQLVDRALRLDPFPSSFMLLIAGVTYRDAGYYEKAIEVCRKAVAAETDFILGYTILASSYSLAGRDDEARAAAAEVLRIDPNFSVKALQNSLPYKNPSDAQRALDSLRKSGLPD
jgi:adenylate cyclase